MVWKKVGEKGSIQYGKGEEFDVDGKKIAIFNKDGYYALDAMCAHQNNSIACGDIDGDRRIDYHEFLAAIPIVESWGGQVRDPKTEFTRATGQFAFNALPNIVAILRTLCIPNIATKLLGILHIHVYIKCDTVRQDLMFIRF